MSNEFEVLVVEHDGEPTPPDECEICADRWTTLVTMRSGERARFLRLCDQHVAVFSGLRMIGDWVVGAMPRAEHERLESERGDETLRVLDVTLGLAHYADWLRSKLASARAELRRADKRHDGPGCAKWQREVDFFYRQLVSLCESP